MPLTAYKTFNHVVQTQIMLWNTCDAWTKAQIGMPLARIEVLKAVQSIADCRVNDIAVTMQITVGAASKIVDKLQESGHINRQPNPADSRSSIVSLTDNGLAVIQQVNKGIEPLLQSYFEGVDQESLNTLLNRIKKNFQSLPENK